MLTFIQWFRWQCIRLAMGLHSALLRVSAFLLIRLRVIEAYQPLEVHGRRLPGAPRPGRSCEDRWSVLQQVLPEGGGSCLDVGCHLGYFTFRMAERGYLVVGIDKQAQYLYLARAIKEIGKYRMVTFLDFELSIESVACLPRFDVVICQSVFHHLVKHHGEDGAIAIMRGLADRCTGQLVFETGQPDEQTSWAPNMAFMQPDPKAWIERFLGELGFARIDCLGRHPTHLSPVPRYLFVASRG